MITWWRMWPIYFIGLFPWVVALLPTIPTKLAIGGLYRQFLANQFLALLPEAKAFTYKQFFVNGDFLDEFIAVIPMLLVLTVAAVWMAYVLGSILITVNNAVVKKTQKSIIEAHK